MAGGAGAAAGTGVAVAGPVVAEAAAGSVVAGAVVGGVVVGGVVAGAVAAGVAARAPCRPVGWSTDVAEARVGDPEPTSSTEAITTMATRAATAPSTRSRERRWENVARRRPAQRPSVRRSGPM